MQGLLPPLFVILSSMVPRPSPAVEVVHQLFTAMQSSDTAQVRSLFLPNARVTPVPAATPLSVDQFVAFVGRNPVGSWVERIWSPVVKESGSLADLWFEYDLYHAGSFSQCGFNAVQLVDGGQGWKIFSMTFTVAHEGCPSHPAP